MSRRPGIPSLLALVALACAACGSSGSPGTYHSTTTSNAGPASPSTGAQALAPASDTTTPAAVTLDGAGASSVEPFFERAFYDYHQADSRTTINYSPAGRSVGVKDIEQGTVDFGDTEIPMSSSDLAKVSAGPVLQVPVDLGGVSVNYNLPGVATGLHLDGPTLAAIFDGSITNWDSPQIAKVSGDSHLPNLRIVPVHRADSSGPGWDLDDYLIKTSSTWASKIGTSTPSTTWPLASVGLGEQLNTGVATYIHQTAGAIGYVEYSYALQAGFDDVALENQAGAFVAPSLASIAAAGAQATKLSSTNYSIIDEPGTGTYPLANFSWTLLYQKQSNEDKGIALGKLFDYAVTTGQGVASSLGYAPLPANVVTLATDTLEQLETASGTPIFTH